jgi:hypothetical protein
MDKRYPIKYCMSEIENLEFIRKNGMRKFVAAESERWISQKASSASTTGNITGDHQPEALNQS